MLEYWPCRVPLDQVAACPGDPRTVSGHTNLCGFLFHEFPKAFFLLQGDDAALPNLYRMKFSASDSVIDRVPADAPAFGEFFDSKSAFSCGLLHCLYSSRTGFRLTEYSLKVSGF